MYISINLCSCINLFMFNAIYFVCEQTKIIIALDLSIHGNKKEVFRLAVKKHKYFFTKDKQVTFIQVTF